MDRAAARDESAARVGAGAPVELRRVAGNDGDRRRIAAERVRRDLRERRRVSLALRREPRRNEHFPARLDADVRALVRTDAGALDVTPDAEPEISPGPARLILLAPKFFRADHVE